MKKLILFTFLVILLASSVLATDVAYVIGGTANPTLMNELNSAGLSYDVVSESQITLTDFSQYGMILVGDDKFDNPENIPVNQYNSLILNSYHFYKKGIIFVDYQWGWSRGKGSITSPSSIELNQGDSSLIEGISKNFWAYNSYNPDFKTYYLTSTKATGVEFIAHSNGASNSNYDSVVTIAHPGTI